MIKFIRTREIDKRMLAVKSFLEQSILYRVIKHFIHETQSTIEAIGNIGFYLRDVFFLTIEFKVDIKKILFEASRIGVDSIALTIMISALAGMIISLQLALEMVKQGAGNFVGAFVTLVMLKELGPIMAAFSVVFMEGSSIAAEIASMKVTDQVSAMKTLNVNPIQYIIAPKVLAGMLIMPLVVVIACIVGIIGGLFTSVANTELTVIAYLESVHLGLWLKDITAALIKGIVFGGTIAIISSVIGYQTTGGALDVGKSTTKAVVWSIIAIAVFDYIISAFFVG